MTEKTAKKLVIFDLDNTLTDTLTFWSRATSASLQVLADELALDPVELRVAVLMAPAQYRFCDFGALVEWLDEKGHLPIAKTTEEAYAKHALKWCVRQRCGFINRKNYPFSMTGRWKLFSKSSGTARRP